MASQPETERGFWAALERPVLAMAPMANVTDAVFRQMFVEAGGSAGRPSVFWTEFVSVEGLLSRGRERLLTDLWFGADEHPIVAQIFGSKPEQFEEVAPMIRDLGFDGIDINMGCPDRGIEKSGAGAALIKDPARAQEIIRAVKRGLRKGAGTDGGAGRMLPVSVKTRIGYAKNELSMWAPALFGEGLAALTMHFRTRNEMSDVPARWDLAPELAAMRNEIAPETLVLGNGDVASPAEARARARAGSIDGVMIGRGLFGNPWFFSGRSPDLPEKLRRMVRHAELFEERYRSGSAGGRLKEFDIMKKHFKAYCSGFDRAKELRIKLMAAENAAEVRSITESFLAAGF